MSLKLDFILLHYALKDKRFTLELSKEINSEYLSPKLQLFYTLITKHFNNPLIREVISLNALSDYCNSHKLSESVPVFKEIYVKATNLTIDGIEPPDSDFKYYLSKLKDRHNLVVASLNITKIQDAMRDHPNDPIMVNNLFKTALQEISAISKVAIFDEGSVGTDVDNMLMEYDAILANPNPFRGVCTGFPSYDDRAGGLHKGELTLLGGMEGSGKSMLMMNMALNAWTGSNTLDTKSYTADGKNVLYFSLEMPRSNKGEFTQGPYLNKRILSNQSRLKMWEIQHGKLSDDNHHKLIRAASFIKDYEEKQTKFHVVDIPRGATVDDIELKYIEVRENLSEVDLVVVDYLGIMAAARDDTDHLMQGKVAENMHEFARAYNVPVLSAVQLNRPSGPSNSLDNQKYNTNRVARSAMISQNANNVMMIETRDNEHQKADMVIHITKMRDGEKGSMVFTKDFPRMRVIDEDPNPSNQTEAPDEVNEFEDFGTNNA